MPFDTINSLKYPLLIDGGLSNVLEQQGCDLNHNLWSASLLENDPEAIVNAHFEYIKAGAQCITTSSYQASMPGFINAGYSTKKAEELIVRSVELAEIAIDRATEKGMVKERPLIAASIGPYGAFLADGSEYRGNYGISDDALIQFHKERVKLLDNSKADLLAIETIPSLQEAKVLANLTSQCVKPVWVSFSCKDQDHINDGTRIEDCVSLFKNHPGIFAVGANCTKPKHISGIIKSVKKVSGHKKIIVYPNSGEAYNVNGKSWMGLSDPEAFVGMAKEWLELGADIIGGCCRIGPGHIGRLKKVIH